MHINICIQALGDPPLFPELKDKMSIEGTLTHVGVLQGGMESGASSVLLKVELSSGIYVAAQLSAEMLLSIAGAVRGAVERFGK